MRLLACLLLLACAVAAQDYGVEYRLKVPLTGEVRKGVLFVPKGVRKGEDLPLLVAVPDTRTKAMLELGQWQRPAYDKHFAVFSVDIVTSGERGWHPSEQLEMQRDMEAVSEGLKLALAKAAEVGVRIDTSAIVMSGFSGGTYLTLWMGIRHPELFLGICGRSCVFFKETVEIGEMEKVEPDLDLPIFLYRGEIDHPRARKGTELAVETLKAAGYTNVTYKVVPEMRHESKPEVFLEWFDELLRKTAKGRAEAGKVRAELAKLRPQVEQGKPGAYRKLARLAERERASRFRAGAVALLDGIVAKAARDMKRAVDLEANNELFEAATLFKQLEKTYAGLDAAKEARERRIQLVRSDAYKAAEMLAKAQHYLDKDQRDKAFDLLEKLIARYPDTPAADRAAALLQG